MPIGHAGGAGQVAPRALPGGHAEELSTPLEERAPARGGQIDVLEPRRRNLFPARPRPVHVAGDADLESSVPSRRGVELVQVPRLLVDHDAGARAERLHVEVGVARELPLHARAGLEGPDVARPVTFGEVVDDAVHPDRIHMTLALPGRGDALPGGRGHDTDRLRLAAAVVPPFGVVVHRLLVRDVLAARGHLPQVRLRQGQRPRQPARRRHRIELRHHGRYGFPVRLEEDRAIRRPALDDVRGRVPGESFGLPAGGRHHVDVGIPSVLAGERDPPAVGAERRIGLRPVGAGQPHGVAAVATRDPEVVGVHEDDARRAHVGLTQKACALGVHGGRHREDRNGQQHGERRRTAIENTVVAEHGRLRLIEGPSMERWMPDGSAGRGAGRPSLLFDHAGCPVATAPTPAAVSRPRPDAAGVGRRGQPIDERPTPSARLVAWAP